MTTFAIVIYYQAMSTDIQLPSFIDLRVDNYNPNKAVRLSDDLFDISKSVSLLSNAHGIKIIYVIAQSIQNSQVDIQGGVPRINISIQALFDYLDLRKSNRRYEYLIMAFQAIMNNPLHLVKKDSNGNISYRGMSWISEYSFSTDKDRLLITLNPASIPLLYELSRYASIQPRHYNALSSAYQLWLYPFLKNKSKMGKFRVKVSDLKILLNSEGKGSYTDAMRGNNTFFRRVLGITISKKAKKENARAKMAKEKPQFIPWDYTIDSSTGKPTGTLYAINTYTDLFVYARGIKHGRSYEEVEFYFASEDFFQKGKWKEELMYAPDLFESISPSLTITTPKETIEKKKGWIVLTDKQVQELLQTFGISNVELLVQKSKTLQIDKEGRVLQYKEIPSK